MAATSLSATIKVVPVGTTKLSFDAAPSFVAVPRTSLCPSLSSTLFAAFPVAPRPSIVRAQALDQETALDAGDDESGAPVEGTKLYVGNLPWNVDSATLAEIFQDAGVVEEVEVMRDRDTNRSRGYAFVLMATPEDAKAAIERFDGSDLGGRVLRVNYPSPPGERRTTTTQRPQQQRRFEGGRPQRDENPNKLYVGNLSWGVDDMALQELFQEFGKVLEARVVMDRETGRSRGFGFVTLSDDGEVQAALNNLNGAEFDGRPLRVNPAAQGGGRP